MVMGKFLSSRPGWWVLALASALMLMTGCATTPYTGRQQVLMVSPEREQALGYQAFSDIRKHSQPAADPALQARVREIGGRIAQAANLYKKNANPIGVFCEGIGVFGISAFPSFIHPG